MELSKVTMEIFSKLEQDWLEGRKARVLSIDCGGIDDSFAAAALVHLEDQIREKSGDSDARIADYVDIVAGSGIGALFAAMLVADDGSGRALFSARDAAAAVEGNRRKLFAGKRLFWKEAPAEEVLKEVFRRRKDGKVLTLNDTLKPILVPCFDLITSAPFVFSGSGAAESPSLNFDLRKVIRATMAAPPTFKPYRITSVDGKNTCLAVGGGIAMKNPTAAAVIHVLHNNPAFPTVAGVDDILVLSIGGAASSKMKLNRNGYLSPASFIAAVMDGASETTDQFLANAFCRNPDGYVRVQPNGVKKNNGTEALAERGVKMFPLGGKRLLTETNGEMIGKFGQRLVELEGIRKSASSIHAVRTNTPPPLDDRRLHLITS